MFDLLSAVKYMHENNVVHRDIKPDNILLVTAMHPLRAKLTDFGLANFVGAQPLTKDKHQRLSGVGTIQFAAPEVLRSDTYGLSADLW